jgi:cytochrome b6-f complex iron-sulfur subunit
MPLKSADSPVPRRSFLDWLLGLGVVGTLASAGFPVIRFLKPLPNQGPGGPLRLTPDETTKLDNNRFVIVRSGTRRLLVFEDDHQKLRALSAKCTHEGCTVQYVPGDNVIWCACHNGRYDLDGRVLSGPPPRPLPQFPVQREDDSVIVSPEPA